MSEVVVNLSWDDDAAVWMATSEDVRGLILESGSFDALIERVKFAAPELMGLNAQEIGQETLSILFKSEKYVQVRI